MSVIQALLLGLVQGITEFLPVSSSGHLAILENLFQIKNQTGFTFEVLLHVGTLGAILAAFWQDLKRLFLEGCKMLYDAFENLKTYSHNRNQQDARRYRKLISNNYRKLLLLLAVTTASTGVMGFVLEGVASQAKGNLLAPAMGFFFTGVFLLVVDFFPAGNKIPRDVGWGAALAIGVVQGIAVFPGISRSGITIALCLLMGFNKKFAVKYSFLAAVPAVVGAAVLELSQNGGKGMSPELIGTYGLSALAAGIVGYFCIKMMLNLVRKKRFVYFAAYCFLAGTAAVVCNFVL